VWVDLKVAAIVLGQWARLADVAPADVRGLLSSWEEGAGLLHRIAGVLGRPVLGSVSPGDK
jgi:hypothetical protein